MSITNDRNDFVTFSNKSSLSELKGFAKDGITTVKVKVMSSGISKILMESVDH